MNLENKLHNRIKVSKDSSDAVLNEKKNAKRKKKKKTGIESFSNNSKSAKILAASSKFATTHGWFPPTELIFSLIFGARILGALYANINDCDEVFNYWEPVHFLQHGHGLQTWEYSPVYAIRSWAYILIHYFPLRFFETFSSNKVIQFYSLRCLLSTLSAICETWMVQEVATYFSPEVGVLTMIFLAGSPGMFHAAPAFLPSSFAMYTTAAFHAVAIRSPGDLWKRNNCLLALGIGCLLGWPFSAAIGIPFVLEELLIPWSERGLRFCTRLTRFLNILSKFIFIALKVSIGIALPMVAIDYYFYKRITIVPFNIVLYNVFGASDTSGPNIFGTEPWNFYFVNGFLNFNGCFVLALLSLPILLVDCFGFRGRPTALGKQNAYSVAFKLAPVYWWLGLFSLQPHKEERFLFVMYPLIAFNSAVALSLLKHRLVMLATKISCLDPKRVALAFLLGVVILYSLLSFGRIYGQYEYYYGTLELYNSFNLNGSALLAYNAGHETPARVCVGGDWYRFPSHYFLPGGTKLSFVKSGFDGLLPKPFPAGSWQESTSTTPNNTNNQNKEEMDRYVSIKTCNFLVTTLPHLDVNIEIFEWAPVRCTHLLNTSSIPAWRRAFYVPSIGPFAKNRPEYYGPCLLKNLAHESNSQAAKV